MMKLTDPRVRRIEALGVLYSAVIGTAALGWQGCDYYRQKPNLIVANESNFIPVEELAFQKPRLRYTVRINNSSPAAATVYGVTGNLKFGSDTRAVQPAKGAVPLRLEAWDSKTIDFDVNLPVPPGPLWGTFGFSSFTADLQLATATGSVPFRGSGIFARGWPVKRDER